MELNANVVNMTPGETTDRPRRTLPDWREASDGLLLTVPAACREMKLGKSLLYEMCARGEITAIKVGRSTRIVRASMVEYIERQIAALARTA
jgi:excisionase family DNA binding protein